MIIRKICGIIARPFKAAIITARLAAASPVRMAPILAPVALTMVSLGMDGCIERYDDFGNAGDDIEFKNPDILDSSLGTEAETSAPVNPCGTKLDTIITNRIIDQNLLKMIRKALNKNELADITLGDALTLTTLLADSSLIYYIDGLECFTNLSVLGLNYNKISDISPVAYLLKLIYFNIYQNQVSDLSPIADHPLLMWVSLAYNIFPDIFALLNNPGIGSGDTVCLDGNDQVPAWQIEALKEKGVNVTCAW